MEQAGHEGIKVSAIVVTYNGLRWVDRCLGSLRNSSWPVRTIVVDNGSIDGTPEHIARHFPEVELIRAERNLGFGQANNRGMRIALDRGDDHVFLLNQDAWVRPDTIGCLVERATAEPGYGVLSPLHVNGAGDALDLAFSNFIVPQRCPGLYSDLVLRRTSGKVYEAEFVNAAAWLITRRCLLTVGGFDPSFFHYAEDDNYLDRLHYHGLQCGIVPEVAVHHDRGSRTENPYFDSRVWRVRKLKLRFADPSKDSDPAAERRQLWFDLLRGILALRKGEVLVARDHLKMHTEADLPSVVRNRELSRAQGPTFL